MQLLATLKPRPWLILAGLVVLVALLVPVDIASADGLGEGLKNILYVIILSLTGWMLWLGGTLLDYGVNTFVINFGYNFRTGGVGVAVDQLWELVRDFFNIFFIFGLVYIGFKMILNSDDSRTKSTLISLIMAALLINFSLFITKFVVDFTNTLATEVAIAGFESTGDVLDGSNFGGSGEDRPRVEIGNTFFGLMGISEEVLNVPDGVEAGTAAPWSYIFGIGIINIIGAFAFGVGGIMLIIRFVVLSIYMVLSPFMFLGWIFPGFKGMSDKYWSGFLKQAFYAPVYIVMIFFSATILNNFFGTEGAMQGGGVGDLAGSNGVLSSLGGDAVAFGGGLGPFILSAAFLIAAVQVAGKLASDGSGMMAKVTGGVNARVRGAVRGSGRFAARNTAGYGARGVGAASNGIANSRAYRRLNTSLGQGKVKVFGKEINTGIGRGIAAGADAALAAGGRASIAGSRTAADQRSVVLDRQKQVNNQRGVTEREDAIGAYLKNPTDENKAKAGGAVAKLTDPELLAVSTTKPGDEKILALMSDAQIKTITESGQATIEEIKTVKSRREDEIYGRFETILTDASSTAGELNEALEALSKAVKSQTGEQLAAMNAKRLNTQAIASQITDKQLDSMRDSGKVPPAQLDAIKKTRSEGLESIAETGGTKGQTIPTGAAGETFKQKQREKITKGSAQDVGKLPVAIFKNAEMYRHLSPQALSQRIRNGEIDIETEIPAIETAIQEYITRDTPESARAKKVWQKWSNSGDVNAGMFELT